MVETLKKAAAALREADIPFLLGGGAAAWARGGQETGHDVDLMVKEEDAERALQALVDVGMRPEKPPEGWLLKAYDGDVLVDLIFRPTSGPITDEVIERGDELEVLSTQMRVMALEDVMVTKLDALNEQHLDLKSVLDIARPVREQIDWGEVRERTKDSPFARAFFTLAEGLEIVSPVSMG